MNKSGKAMVAIALAVLPLASYAGLPSMSGWPVLREYRGACLRRVKMPLGGIGTGAVYLSGSGGLGAFEVRNSAERGFVPCRQSVFPAFVVRTEDGAGAVTARLLEGPLDKSLYEGALGCPAPNHGYPRFRNCVFRAAYPLAEVELSDAAVPVKATLEAMNPLVKGDAESSGMPVALLRRNHIKDLRQSLVKLEHTQKQYYHFQTRQKIGKEGYERWAQALLAKQYAV